MSNSELRYEGVLYTINTQDLRKHLREFTKVLQQVYILGGSAGPRTVFRQVLSHVLILHLASA